MITAVFAKVIHMGEDYATIKLTAQIHDSENQENHMPSEEFEVSRSMGEWLEEYNAYDYSEEE